jgi:hypothetical protein
MPDGQSRAKQHPDLREVGGLLPLCRPQDEDRSTGCAAPARPAPPRSVPDRLGARSGHAGCADDAHAPTAPRPDPDHLKNGLHAIALNQRLARGSKLLRRARLAQLQALVLPAYTAQATRILKVSYKTLLTKVSECGLTPPSRL